MRPSILIHGQATRLTSFTLVTRRLLLGLRARGWRATLLASDVAADRRPSAPLPDVYLFFGHPYDLANAPGRVNAFYLSYDYARFTAADRDLAPRLNAMFDLVLTPSTFSAKACRRSGVTRPIVICPHGVDTGEFHPRSPGAGGHGNRGPFEFLALGGAYERKGTDVLLRAYTRAFRDTDSVRLVIKAFSYDHLLPWVEQILARAHVGRPGSPAVVFEHSEVASVARYYRAADVGVFPFRGEAFALTILECLASGTPVIATHGCGPLDYAKVGVDWIPATPARRGGREQLEPHVKTLARLMRRAFERGRPSPADRRRIAEAVREWSWERAVSVLDASLRDLLDSRVARSAQRYSPTALCSKSAAREDHVSSVPPARMHVAFAHYAKGSTSWRLVARHVGALLGRQAGRVSSHGWRDPRFNGNADTVVGQSGFCLEAFRASIDRRPDARRILYRESGPFETLLAIANRERARCGVPERPATPMDVWRHDTETRLADRIVVLSAVSRDLFLAGGYPSARLRVVRPGVDLLARQPVRRRGTVRFLFAASDPFRKGVRVLLEAWRRANLRHAELICVAGREILTSRLLLKTFVEDPTIRFMSFLPHRRFLALYEEIDCVLLPTFEDGFPYTVADAMARGIPAIVSDRAGIHEILTAGEDAWIVPGGSVDALAQALSEAVDSRARRAAIGAAAHETAGRWTWRRFEDAFAEVVFS